MSKAVETLIRNKLNSNKMTYEKKQDFFHKKGVYLKKVEEGLYFLRQDGTRSELSELCNGIVFRDSDLICYHGSLVKESSLKESDVLWNDKTVFIEYIKAQRYYMYWDNGWSFADDKQARSPFGDTLKDLIYNINASDYRFTYAIFLHEDKIYLDSMYDNKLLKEVSWKKIEEYASNHKYYLNSVYKFEGFDVLEDSDFPIYVQDQTMKKVLITGK